MPPVWKSGTLAACAFLTLAWSGHAEDGGGRILGVIPNFQTVSPERGIHPLTARQKWALFARESTDPFNMAGLAFGAGLANLSNAHPRYGYGGRAYADRFAAAAADMTAQNFFGDAVFGSLFHQDPRYFRKGPQARISTRIFYALSRVAVTRQDSGRRAFNISQLLGMAMGVGLSNAYYPSASANGTVMMERVRTSLTSAVFSNLLPEFWPDIRDRFLHRHHRKP